MEISELTIKIIFLLIPGAIASIIYERLTINHKKPSDLKFLTNALLFGVGSYFILGLLMTICTDYEMKVWQNVTSEDIPYNEVFLASVLSVCLGLLISTFETYKLLHKLASKFKISYKYGDENLYSYFLNLENTDEVYIRDIDTGHTFHGKVNSYSEKDDFSEIVLYYVTVYESATSVELYKLNRVYLSRRKDSITIELPNQIETNGKRKSKKRKNK